MGDPRGTGRVSVVLATFNGERYLQQQLDSLRQQWRTPDELIVVDDGSTDRTLQLVRRFAEQAPFRVVVMDRPQHRGTNETFGEAISLATGDVIVTCDQDDRWYPDKISLLVESLEAQPDAFIAFSDAGLIDAEGRSIGRSRWRVAGFSPIEQAAMSRDPLGQMLARRVMSGCTAAIRAELVPAVLPVPKPMHPSLNEIMYDHWISLVAAAAGPIVMVPRQLVDYRIHPSQQIGIPGLTVRRWAPRTSLRLAQFRASRYEIDRRMEFDSLHLEEIRQRLAMTGLGSEATERVLDMANRHLRSRQALPEDRIRRVADVMSELRHEHGYRRFALGAATAFADLTR
ncbi:MAG: glycosyltransferase family 2 protein [Acidimicrobiales bacterium]